MYSEEIGSSCGVREMMEVHKGSLLSFLREVEEGCPYSAFIVFSDNDNGNGQTIADGLNNIWKGSILETEWKVNPNSGASIKVWVFTKPSNTFISNMIKTLKK